MQLSFVAGRARCGALIALIVMLSSCGGGGGGDSSGGTNPSTPPAGTDRSGVMVYTSINKTNAVNMANGTTRLLFTPDLSRSYVGAGVGPNGEMAVAYNSSTTGPTSELTILKADGSTEISKRLNYTIQGQPKFSPDGSKLAFTAGVYTSGKLRYFTQVISRAGEELFYFNDLDRPGWTPDGRLIFISEDGKLDLYVTKADFLQQLTLIPNSSNIGSFSVHPDGTKIAFSRGVGGAARHIYVMNFDGSNTTQITTSSNSEETRVLYSPNGKELLVTSYGCIGVSDSGLSSGDVNRDLIHVIPADSRMLDIRGLANSGASSRLLDEAGATRCTDASPSWR
jgi:Tol biopolymer transport system component